MEFKHISCLKIFRSTRNKHSLFFQRSKQTNQQEKLKVVSLWHQVWPALDCFDFRERKIHIEIGFYYNFSKTVIFASAEIVQWILELKKNSNCPNMELLMNKWSSGRKINSSFPVKYLSYRSFWLKNDCPRIWFRMHLKHRHRTMRIQNTWVTLKPRLCTEHSKSDLEKVIRFVWIKWST